MLNEVLDLSKPFEREIEKDKEAVKGFQLEKYFTLDDIKIKKRNDGTIAIHTLYRHNRSNEIIDILWVTLRSNETKIYRFFNNADAIKYFKRTKNMPHMATDVFQKHQKWEFDVLSTGE